MFRCAFGFPEQVEGLGGGRFPYAGLGKADGRPRGLSSSRVPHGIGGLDALHKPFAHENGKNLLDPPLCEL